METLSQKAQELLRFMQEQYIDNGYLYSGSWSYTSLTEHGFSKETILELQSAGLIQKRDCDAYAFELSVKERGDLIANHSLCSVWYEKTGDGLLDSIQQEARSASEVSKDSETGLLTVRTMKNEGAHEHPDQMTVSCPFSVGQLIDLEYDLPKKFRWLGYSRGESIMGPRIGQFMVTNVIHNMLAYPRMNMLELQSLSAEFNQVHPDSRTMLIFEDVVLKRMKDKSFDSPELEAIWGDICNLRHELDGVMGYPGEEELVPEIEKRLFVRECQMCAAMKGVDIDTPRLDSLVLDEALAEQVANADSLEDFLEQNGFFKKATIADQIQSASNRTTDPSVAPSKGINQER